MDNKKKILLASLLCALVVICAGTAIIWVLQNNDSAAIYQKQIQVADKYFAKGDYENAIIEYKAAIEKDKKEEKPYQRLAMIYLSQNEMTLAKNILSRGITNTASPKLQKMWETYFGKDLQADKDDEVDGQKDEEEKNTENQELQEKSTEEIFAVEGQIVDATTGSGVTGAIINIRAEGDQTGEVLFHTTTSSDGSYMAELACGYYLAEVRLEGYTTEYFELYVDDFGDMENEQFVISPAVENGQIRIVLEWGSSPSDLDSYLEGTLSDGTEVSISFRNTTLEKNGEKIVTLDVDDRDGYGPETTTINDSNGTYHFYVVDFRQEGTLGINGATVKVYMPGESAPTVIQAPSDVENMWDVLNIEQGVLTVNNGELEADAQAEAK